MSLIKNKIVADAVKAEFPNQLFFGKMASVVAKDVDLKGAGSGDTKTITNFELGNTDLQVLGKYEEITATELGQSQYSVMIQQLAHGKKYHDQDVKYSVSGNSLDAEASRQIAGAFAHGMDELQLAALTTKSTNVEVYGNFTVDKVLDEATLKYGEKVFNGDIVSLCIHPEKFPEIRKDPDFEPISRYGYEAAQFGRAEVGRLYGEFNAA